MGRKRVTQAQVAQALGMSQAAVSRRLGGQLPFDVDDLARLADLFGTEVSELLGITARPYSAWNMGVDSEEGGYEGITGAGVAKEAA